MDHYEAYYTSIPANMASSQAPGGQEGQAHGGQESLARQNHIFHRSMITGHNDQRDHFHNYLGSHQRMDGHISSQQAQQQPQDRREVYPPSMIQSTYADGQPDNHYFQELHSTRPTQSQSLQAYTSLPTPVRETREANSLVVQRSRHQSTLRRYGEGHPPCPAPAGILGIHPEVRPNTSSQTAWSQTKSSQTGSFSQTTTPAQIAITSQRNNQGRRCQEVPAGAPQSAPINTNIPLTNLTQASTSTRAIVNAFLPNSLRGEGVSTGLPSTLPTPDDMMKKSAVELRMLASKYAKKSSSLPAAMQHHFMRLHDEFDKVLAINCINNQVSVALVHKLWYLHFIPKSLHKCDADVQYHRGEKGLRKGANSWQKFHQSEEARQIYRDSKCLNSSDDYIHL